MNVYTVRPGDTIQLAPAIERVAPVDIHRFLTDRGWASNGNNWQHHSKQRWDVTWEQAMACEFYEFVTLGGR